MTTIPPIQWHLALALHCGISSMIASTLSLDDAMNFLMCSRGQAYN
jgi:hypothetical protein